MSHSSHTQTSSQVRDQVLARERFLDDLWQLVETEVCGYLQTLNGIPKPVPVYLAVSHQEAWRTLAIKPGDIWGKEAHPMTVNLRQAVGEGTVLEPRQGEGHRREDIHIHPCYPRPVPIFTVMAKALRHVMTEHHPTEDVPAPEYIFAHEGYVVSVIFRISFARAELVLQLPGKYWFTRGLDGHT